MTANEDVVAAWVALGGTAADDVAAMLVARHGEPHRRYHTAEHVSAVLRHVDALAAGANDLDAIRAAALFHDIVYDPASSTNERDSAELAAAALSGIGWHTSRCEHVATMIEATAGHTADEDADTAILMDADLAILGASPDAYARYAAQVREEYSFVDDDSWRAGRPAVLRTFLEREHVYVTAAMRREREQQARQNIEHEIAALER